ncbi:iron-containing alcohol dehydrogenase [Spirillospora sp. CA-255316]
MDQFCTIFGRNLIGELTNIVNRPFGVVTMDDLWPRYAAQFAQAPVRVVKAGLDHAYLEKLVAESDDLKAIVGLGGGQALDTAKYLSWRLDLPLFQVPTALSVNAAWGHRSAVRTDGIVSYVGWALPQAVFVDYDVIRSAPRLLNTSGAADVLCYHTGLWDWKMAGGTGHAEPQWPYDPRLAAASHEAMRRVIDNADAIREMTDAGIEALTASLKYGGGAFAYAGWTPRHIEGAEHFVFYALEYVTGRSFLHGQAVGLGILIASAMQNNDPDGIRTVLDRLGVPYTPQDMGITWGDVRTALGKLPEVVEKSKLWYTIASARAVTPQFFDAVRAWISDPSAPAWQDPERSDHDAASHGAADLASETSGLEGNRP